MGERGFIALNWLRQGHAGPPARPDLPFARLLTALRLRPRRALSSAEAESGSVPVTAKRNEISPADIIIPLLTAQSCPLLIAPRQSVIDSFVDYDGNGNVSALVSADGGTVSAQYEYGPFGEVISGVGGGVKHVTLQP